MTNGAEDLFDGKAPVETVTPVETQENALEALVGEGKKYKDLEALAKANLEKDSFIERLQTEGSEIRQELEKRLTIDEFMQKLEAKRLESGTSNDGTPPSEPPKEEISKEGLTREEISELLKQELSSQTKEQQKQSNLSEAISELNKIWGSDTKVKLNQRASELGISVQELKAHAENNPKVFLSLVKPETPVQGSATSTVFQSSTDTGKTPATNGEKTKSYYDRMRKDNPKAYWSKTVQNEMHRQALKLKDDFFR